MCVCDSVCVCMCVSDSVCVCMCVSDSVFVCVCVSVCVLYIVRVRLSAALRKAGLDTLIPLECCFHSLSKGIWSHSVVFCHPKGILEPEHTSVSAQTFSVRFCR